MHIYNYLNVVDIVIVMSLKEDICAI